MTLQLQATKTAILNRDFDKLNEIIEVEGTKLTIPKFTSVDFSNYIQDDLANLLIPDDIPYPNEDVCAIKTVGNGNCLFNSISYFLCQSADLALTLRTLTAAELFLNATKYTNHPTFVNCLDLPEVTFAENNLWSLLLRDDASSRMNVSRKEAVEIEALNTANNYTWSGILDILALSSVIKTKIWCCYPECNSVIRPLMNGCVRPLSVELDTNAMVMILWSRDGQLDNTPNQPYEPNHFVPIIYLRPISMNYENHDNCENDDNIGAKSSGIPAKEKEKRKSDKEQDQVPKKKQRGAGLYKTNFNKDWSKEFPFIKMGSTKHHYWCTVCRVENDCSHQGKTDIIRHVNGQGHQQKVKDLRSSQSLFKFTERMPHDTTEMNKLETQARRAEVKVATCMAKHNIPLAFADHLSPLIKEIFTDSDIAKKYSSAKTKTTCIINGALKSHFQEGLVSFMQQHPFTLSIDGSNDTGLQKMNPITVKIFDVNEIRHQFLDMCTTTGTKCGAAETIFVKMDSVMKRHKIPWKNCVALSVDNASVNLGIRNSLMTRIKDRNEAVYFFGCPCHIIHNTASKAADSFGKMVGFDVEDLCVDVFYWFDKSSNRKGSLAEFCTFCDIEYKQTINHASTRWLSLQTCIDRNLMLYDGLKSYFNSKEDSAPRFKRLKCYFQDPMTEVFLYFLQGAIPMFTNLNLLLQRGIPSIHIMYTQIFKFLKLMMAKLVQPEYLAVERCTDLLNIDFSNREIQCEDEGLTVGRITKSKLNKMLNEGDVAPADKVKLYRGVRKFYEVGIKYAVDHLPFNDEVLENAQFVDFNRRCESNFNQVLYFCERYNTLLQMDSVSEQQKLFEEFVDYQTLSKTDIPQHIWIEAVLQESVEDDSVEYLRMEILWGYLALIRDPVTGGFRFGRLSKVAKLVLTLPHSNADEERVFSFIKLNKTDTRNSLDLNETLSSLLTVKMAVPEPCFKFEPTNELLKMSKSATWNYNKEHKKQ